MGAGRTPPSTPSPYTAATSSRGAALHNYTMQLDKETDSDWQNLSDYGAARMDRLEPRSRGIGEARD